MSTMSELLLFSALAGITVFLGGLVAHCFDAHTAEGPRKQVILHAAVSLGAGIILSAVALVLIPQGLEELHTVPMAVAFLAGAFSFLLIDRYLNRRGGKTATLLAMMMDFVPESIALGAMFTANHKTAILLSVFIGLQNLPEAFCAYRDLKVSSFKPQKILIVFFFLSFSGMIGALLGRLLLGQQPEVTAFLMAFSGGGILYLLFQDIIPESKLPHTYAVSLCAAFGFLIGVIGEKVI